MAKKKAAAPQPKTKPKKETTAEAIKRIERQNTGKSKSKEVKMQLKLLNFQLKEEQKEKKAEAEERMKLKKEKERKMEHEKKLQEVQKEAEKEKKENKLLCRFFIEAPIEIQRSGNFACPNPGCKDLHELSEELTLEDTLEMEMERVRKGQKINKEVFDRFLKNYIKEREIFEKKKIAIKSGIDLFSVDPSIFKDDENAGDDTYENMGYQSDEES